MLYLCSDHSATKRLRHADVIPGNDSYICFFIYGIRTPRSPQYINDVSNSNEIVILFAQSDTKTATTTAKKKQKQKRRKKKNNYT